MSEAVNPAGNVAPVVVPQPIVPPTPPVVVQPPKPHTTTDDLPPEALKARLEQAKSTARAELLAELGVADTDSAKAAIVAAKAADEAKKSDAQKLAELNTRVASYEEALGAAVAMAVAQITPEQKAVIDTIAGTDRSVWLRTYNAMVPIMAKATAPAPTPAPPNTSPTTPAPPAISNNTSPPDHAAVYRKLQQDNPFAAARYLQQHGDQCAGKQ